MRLTHYSDYALRTLMYLALCTKHTVTIQVIASAYQIPHNHLVKVVHRLATLGYIETSRGKGGGIKLARLPEEINLGALLRDTESKFNIVECFDSKHNRCVLTPECVLRGVINEALERFLNVFDQHTLADVVHKRLRPLLKIANA